MALVEGQRAIDRAHGELDAAKIAIEPILRATNADRGMSHILLLFINTPYERNLYAKTLLLINYQQANPIILTRYQYTLLVVDTPAYC